MSLTGESNLNGYISFSVLLYVGLFLLILMAIFIVHYFMLKRMIKNTVRKTIMEIDSERQLYKINTKKDM